MRCRVDILVYQCSYIPGCVVLTAMLTVSQLGEGLNAKTLAQRRATNLGYVWSNWGQWTAFFKRDVGMSWCCEEDWKLRSRVLQGIIP